MDDFAALEPRHWRAKLANLRANMVADNDPRVQRAEAALSYWRLRRTAEREIDGGHLRREVAEVVLDSMRHWPPTEADEQASEASSGAESEKTSGLAEDGTEAADTAVVERHAVEAGVVSAAAPR